MKAHVVFFQMILNLLFILLPTLPSLLCLLLAFECKFVFVIKITLLFPHFRVSDQFLLPIGLCLKCGKWIEFVVRWRCVLLSFERTNVFHESECRSTFDQHSRNLWSTINFNFNFLSSRQTCNIINFVFFFPFFRYSKHLEANSFDSDGNLTIFNYILIVLNHILIANCFLINRFFPN